MPESYRNSYSFISQGAPRDAFHVVRFDGEEGLSRPYSFDIMLLSEKKDLDLGALSQSPATFSMKFEDTELPFHGVPALFETLDSFQGFVFHRVVLVPKLWWLTLTHHNQIFLDKDLQGFLGQVLTDGGLAQGKDFEFRLSRSYSPREYVCQYRETHFDFLSRWLERDGLYYYFEQPEDGEKMVITDARTVHGPMPGVTSLRYMPPSGLDWPLGASAIKSFSRLRSQTPSKVTVLDRNYRTPSVKLSAETKVSGGGKGEQVLYGDHIFTEDEAKYLAQVRSEELACRETLFRGLSCSPHLRSGFLFKLENHFRDDLNDSCLTVEVNHVGGQEAYLAQLLGISLPNAPDKPHYRNTFTAIAANVQFRPARRAEKPSFYGVMNATIDAAGSGQYAEVDDQGRYKVILPFDLSGREDGKASSWLRMIQPYGGSTMGLHFPLHKGCEVLLAFQDGDPDRPVIQAAVPNPEHKSQTTSDNATKCMFTSGGGNLMHIEDRQGSERILLQSPTQNSWVRCGQPNDPASERADDMLGWKLNTSNAMLARAGLYDQMILGTVEWEYIGNYFQGVVGNSLTIEGLKKAFNLSKKIDINVKTLIMQAKRSKALGEQVALDEECVKVAGEVTKLRASATELDDMRQELEAKRTTLTQNRQQLSQTKVTLTGDKQTLTQEKTRLTEELAELDGEKNELTQSKQTLGQEKITLEAQKNELTQQKTLLTENNTTVGLQNERLQATRTVVTDMNSALVGFRTLT